MCHLVQSQALHNITLALMVLLTQMQCLMTVVAVMHERYECSVGQV